jgi:hypothetical protein
MNAFTTGPSVNEQSTRAAAVPQLRGAFLFAVIELLFRVVDALLKIIGVPDRRTAHGSFGLPKRSHPGNPICIQQLRASTIGRQSRTKAEHQRRANPRPLR